MTATSFNIYQQLTSVRLLSANNLSGTYFNGNLNNGVGATLVADNVGLLSIDGVDVNVGDRVLLSTQTAANQNGIYVVKVKGSGISKWILERSNDFQSLEQIKAGQYLSVGAGEEYAGSVLVVVEPLPSEIGSGDIGFVFVDVSGSEPPPSALYLKKDQNLRDVDDPDTALSNLGTGTGEVLVINDGDFSSGFYQIPIPYPNIVEVSVTTPDLELRLPRANIPYDSPSIGQGLIIKSINSTEELNIATAFSGSIISSLTGYAAAQFILQDNSTNAGVWHEEPYTYQVNGQTGDVTLDIMPNIPLDQGQIIVGVDSSDPVAGDITSSDGSIIIDTGIDGVINLTASPAISQSLQAAYDVGNTIQISDDRPLTFFSQETGTPVESVSSPSTGTLAVPAYTNRGWTFIPSQAINIVSVQYLDANFTNQTRTINFYNKNTRQLLLSQSVAKTDPLVGAYRTKTLTYPVFFASGIEYVIDTVVYPTDFYSTNADAIPSADIAITGIATGVASGSPIQPSYPTSFTATPNWTPAGYFQYELLSPGATITYSSAGDGNSYFQKAESSTLGNIPLPVMSTDLFRAIPNKEIGLMAFSSGEFRPLVYNGIGQNQLLAYLTDIKSSAEGGGYGLTIDSGNTSDANSISIIYSSFQRIDNRVNVTARLTFVPTAIDPVIAFYTTLNLIPFSGTDEAAGLGNVWLTVSPTGMDGSAQVESIASASSIAVNMITPAFDSIKSYELNVIYSYAINPDSLLTPFISVWNTEATTPSEDTIELPLSATGVYSFIVDWGDGNYNYINDPSDPAVTHVYDSPGIYTVRLFGTVEGFKFAGSSSDPSQLSSISQWGILQVCGGSGEQGGYFDGCDNLEIVATDIIDLTSVTSLEDAFNGCISITSIPNVGSWDISSITDATDFLNGVTLDTDNYNSLLVGWADQTVQVNVTFSGGNSHYDGDGVAARAILTGAPNNWTITDGGTP